MKKLYIWAVCPGVIVAGSLWVLGKFPLGSIDSEVGICMMAALLVWAIGGIVYVIK